MNHPIIHENWPSVRFSRWFRLKRFFKNYDLELLVFVAILAIGFALFRLFLQVFP